MSDELIADVPNEGDVIKDTAFEKAEDNVEKTTSESQPGNKQTEKPSQGGELAKDNTPDEQIPFHKHPRWIARQKENDDLKAQLAELDKKIKDVEPFLQQQKSQEVSLPDWWTKTYGDSEQSKKDFRNYQEATKAERDRIKSEIVQEIQTESTKQAKAQEEADAYMADQVQELIADEVIPDEQVEINGKMQNPHVNSLMKFIVDFQDKYGPGSLLDAKGNYDLKKSFALMQEFQAKPQPKSTEVKKKIASETMKTKVSSPIKSDLPIVSRTSLRRGNWRDAQ